MSEPVLKAFVLCDAVTDTSGPDDQKDLHGAGLAVIRVSGSPPIKRTFWVYIEITHQQPAGSIRLSIMRADSGRRLFFRQMPIEFRSQLQNTLVTIRIYDCLFPSRGVYFIELWYDGVWLLDQRLEVI